MVKYEVVKFDIETDKGRYQEIRSAFIGCEYYREEVASFNTLHEARECLACIRTSVQPMSGYYLHECKCIEVNRYNVNGEFICMEGEKDVVLPCVEEFKYYTAAAQSGDIIDEFDTYEEAEDAIIDYEKEDEEDGNYTPNFYTIVTFKGGFYE